MALNIVCLGKNFVSLEKSMYSAVYWMSFSINVNEVKLVDIVV